MDVEGDREVTEQQDDPDREGYDAAPLFENEGHVRRGLHEGGGNRFDPLEDAKVEEVVSFLVMQHG